MEKVFFFLLILQLTVDAACQCVSLLIDCWELQTCPSPMPVLAETGKDKSLGFQTWTYESRNFHRGFELKFLIEKPLTMDLCPCSAGYMSELSLQSKIHVK